MMTADNWERYSQRAKALHQGQHAAEKEGKLDDNLNEQYFVFDNDTK